MKVALAVAKTLFIILQIFIGNKLSSIISNVFLCSVSSNTYIQYYHNITIIRIRLNPEFVITKRNHQICQFGNATTTPIVNVGVFISWSTDDNLHIGADN